MNKIGISQLLLGFYMLIMGLSLCGWHVLHSFVDGGHDEKMIETSLVPSHHSHDTSDHPETLFMHHFKNALAFNMAGFYLMTVMIACFLVFFLDRKLLLFFARGSLSPPRYCYSNQAVSIFPSLPHRAPPSR